MYRHVLRRAICEKSSPYLSMACRLMGINIKQTNDQIIRASSTTNLPTTPNLGSEDILAGQLRKANPGRLLELIETHCSVMNNSHLVSALESLFEYKKDDVIPHSIVTTDYFVKLCRRLKQRAQYFDVDDVVNVLKCLSFLGMSSDSSVMQTYWQMLRHQINDLSLKQVLYLEFLLKKQNPTPLIEAFKIALPMVLENQLDLQFDSNDLPSLVQLFTYGINHGLSSKFLNKVANAIVRSNAKLDAKLAVNVLWSWARLKKPVDCDKQLYNLALETLTAEIDNVSPASLVSLISFFNLKRLFCGSLLKVVSKRAVDEMWPMSLTYSLVCAMVNVDSFDLGVLDWFAELVVRNEAEVKLNPGISIFSIMEAYGRTNFTPHNFDAVLKVITNSTEKIRHLSEKPGIFVKFALNFITFGSYPPTVLDLVCRERFSRSVQAVLQGNSTSMALKEHLLKEMLLLHQSLLSNNIDFHWPEKLRMDAMTCIKEGSKELPILKLLQKALGGHQYVLSQQFTKSGLFVEHYVVLRQGDYPMAFKDAEIEKGSQDFEYIDDVAIPNDSKKVAVVVLRLPQLNSDSFRINGLAQLHSHLLLQEGFHVVQIIMPHWEAMPEHEKTLFLMREIKAPSKKVAVENAR